LIVLAALYAGTTMAAVGSGDVESFLVYIAVFSAESIIQVYDGGKASQDVLAHYLFLQSDGFKAPEHDFFI
jgi:hypothetical protein